VYLLSFLLSTAGYLFAECDCSAPAPCPSTDPNCQPQTPGPCSIPSAAAYILRYAITGEHGAMTFIGNTLGLSKELCLNEPGTSDAIGAFTTTDPSQIVGTYPSATTGDGSPGGTTLNWLNNGSSAVLSIPAGATILYAELCWGGSFGYCCEASTGGSGVDPNCILQFADGPINFTTADGVVHPVTADPTTSMLSQNPAPNVQPFYCAGNYTRSANVTNLFLAASLANPNGTYTVSGVPATVSGLDNTHNCAGWTLAIIYRDMANPHINNMSIFVGAQQGSRAPLSLPAAVNGFCAATATTLGPQARLMVSCLEGDANKTGDMMMFGPNLLSLTALSGPNNPVNNFFASQINDDSGNLINTTGTFCLLNANPFTHTLISGGRQGYDITNVDCTSTIMPNQTTAVALGTTVGDDYTINAVGIQISVVSPVIVPIKKVNGQNSIESNIGDTVTFTITIDNTGLGGASNVFIQDILEPGLMLVPGTFKVNNVLVPGVTGGQLATGVSLGSINEMDIVTIEYNVMIIAKPISGNVFHNFATSPFDFIACSRTQPFHSVNNSNVVLITLPNPDLMPPPTNFIGTVTTSKFLNTTKRCLQTTWVPSPLPSVVSYLIFKNGVLVKTVPASGPYVFDACIHSKSEASEFAIVALYPNNIESAPLPIRIVNE